MAHDLFLSHSSKDKQIADQVLAALETVGIKCWIAPRDIGTGEIFPVAIAEAITNSKLMVLIFSENSNTSKDVANELILAMDESIKIIPFRIEDVKPKGAMRYYLTGAQWQEATLPLTAENLQSLVRTVNSLIGDLTPDLTPVPLTIGNSNPHDGQVNQAYSFTLQAAGGKAPFKFSITAGKLPNGLELDAEGTLSGTPLQDGTFIFAVQVKDSASATASHIFTMNNEPAPLPLRIDTAVPHDAQVNSVYSFSFKAIGGSAPYNYFIAAGKLPPGLKLDNDGTLSGTPEKAGTYTFTVRVDGSKTEADSYKFTLTARAVTVTKSIPVEPKSKTEDQKPSKSSVFKHKEWSVRAAVTVALVLLVIGAVYLIIGMSDNEEMAGEPPAEEPVEVVIDDLLYMIDYESGTIPLSDLEIGSRIVDLSWEWEFRTGDNYAGSGEVKPIIWIVVAKDHYDGLQPHITLLTEELIGKHTFDNSTNRGNDYGSNHWGNSGTSNATHGLRPWLNSTGIHSGEGFFRAFSEGFIAAVFATTLPNKDGENGTVYSTVDHVFLPSTTELGGSSANSPFPIGIVYPYFSGADNAIRVACLNGEAWWYRTRSPGKGMNLTMKGVNDSGEFYGNYAYDISCGVRPALNLKSGILVSEIRN